MLVLQSVQRPSRALRRWMAALGLYVWFAAPSETSAEIEVPSVEVRRTDAVLIGSSSFNQPFGLIIARELASLGYQVTRKGVSGAGLARPDYHDMYQELESLPISKNTAAVFVYLGVNDTQAVWLHPHERGPAGSPWVSFGVEPWDAVYALRTRDFLERICQRGARRAVVLLPVDVNRPDLQARLHRIRALQELAAATTSCAVTVQTAGDAGDFEVAGVPKRLPDGFHMSSLGAQLVWERIQPQVLHLLEAETPL